MAQVQLGDKAPQFALKDKDGVLHSLAFVGTPYAVVYFYPKDDTPGCTIEAKEFSRHLEMIRRAGGTVFGISGGDERTKSKFCDKHSLSVTLLSDPDFSISKAFGAYGEKQFMGQKFMGILRNTYVIDREGKIVGIFEKVSPESHAEEILKFLRGGAVMKAPEPAPPPLVKTVATPKRRSSSAKKSVRKPVRKVVSRKPQKRAPTPKKKQQQKAKKR